jgi:hypothetical protein
MILPAWTTRSWRRPTRAGFTGLVSSSGGRSKRFSRGLTGKKGFAQACEAVLFRARTGCPWRDLPAAYGPWHTIYMRWHPWVDAGVPESAPPRPSWRPGKGPTILTRPWLCSTRPWCAPTSMPRGRKKKRGVAQPALGRSRGGPFDENPPGGPRRAYGARDEPERGPSQRRAPGRATRRLRGITPDAQIRALCAELCL